MCGNAAVTRHSESERVMTNPQVVVHDPLMDSTASITNADIVAAKRMWLSARDSGAPQTEVDATHRWYASLVGGQARQVREAFWRRAGAPSTTADGH